MRFHVYSVLTALCVAALGFIALQYVEPTPKSRADNDEPVEPVNAVIGNQSFRAVHGRAPSSQTPEHLRLRTHLAYVESVLRQRDISHLSAEQRTNRTHLLDALHDYWIEGQFPRNTETSDRTPVFVDDDGRLCAVAHLIAQSAGRSHAETVDESYHLSLVRDIDTAMLDRWAKANGLTRRELAMIQPMYCQFGGRDCIIREQEDNDASSLELAGLTASVSASVVNGALLELDSPSLVGGALGVAGGATSFGAGLADDAEYPTISIAAGATSVALGTWSVLAALRGDGVDESVSARRRETWRLQPTTITTVRGDTRPGLTARITF